MRKILLLAESLRINETSSGIVTSTFIKALFEAGYNITVITGHNFSYPVTWLPAEITVKQFEMPLPRKRFIDYIPKVRAVPTFITGFQYSFRLTINCWKEEIKKAVKESAYDLIYVLGSGMEFAPHFAVSEMKIGIPYIINFHDPFPVHVYPEPYRRPRNIQGVVLEKKIRHLISGSYKVSLPSQLLLDHMSGTFPELKKKGFVIPHIGIELDSLPGKDDDSLIQLQKDKINIVHAGSLLGPRNPAYLIRAIVELKGEAQEIMKGVQFIFIGKIAGELKKSVETGNAENISFYDLRLSYKKSLEITELSDCMMVIEAISSFSPFMPGKLADIAFKEKPIIALTPDNSEVMRLLGKNYPYHAPLDSVEEIKKAIVRFLTDLKEMKTDLVSVKNLKDYVSADNFWEILKTVWD